MITAKQFFYIAFVTLIYGNDKRGNDLIKLYFIEEKLRSDKK